MMTLLWRACCVLAVVMAGAVCPSSARALNVSDYLQHRLEVLALEETTIMGESLYSLLIW